MKKLLIIIAGSGCFILTGQEGPAPTVYTAAQAAAGRISYQNACAKCHTDKLTGRKGQADEVPPFSSLSADTQEFIRVNGGKVPPLAGSAFLNKWGARATNDLSTRIMMAAMEFTGTESASEERYLNLTAYVLQTNGAKAGTAALTTKTGLEIRWVTTGQ